MIQLFSRCLVTVQLAVAGLGLCDHNENKSNAVAEQKEVSLVTLGSISNQLLHYSTGPGQQPSHTYTHFGLLTKSPPLSFCLIACGPFHTACIQHIHVVVHSDSFSTA